MSTEFPELDENDLAYLKEEEQPHAPVVKPEDFLEESGLADETDAFFDDEPEEEFEIGDDPEGVEDDG